MYAKSPRGLRATWGPTGRRLRTTCAVRVLWMRGLPSYGIDGPPYEVDKGIRPVLLGEFAYCLKCGGRTFSGGLGEGSLCGRVVEGFLALFCVGFSWRVFGRLLWLCVLVGVVVD